MSLSSSSSSLPSEPRQTSGRKSSRTNQKRARRRAYTTHRHTIGSFREGSKPAQPPWCIVRWRQHDEPEYRVLCFGDGLAINLLYLGEDLDDEFAKQEQAIVYNKASAFENFASIDLSDKLELDHKIFFIASMATMYNSVLIGVQSVASPMLVDLEHKAVKCTFKAPEDSGELACLTTSDSDIFATGYDSGKVILWSLSDIPDSHENHSEEQIHENATNHERTAAPVMVASNLNKPVAAMSFKGDHLAVATKAGELIVNLVISDYRCELLRKFTATEYGEPLFVNWSSATKVVSGGEDDIITVHYLDTKREPRHTQLHGHTSYVTDAVSSGKQTSGIVTCSLDGRLIAWTNSSKKVLVHELGESFYGVKVAGPALYTLSVDSNGKWSLNRYVISPKHHGG
mmetsp:Transcript_6902/g.20996  ORF Transcript_6902/g.20996 Transcript_6902/m.20996 type:complete len:400 (-) Transcript_6902:88-1287(-)